MSKILSTYELARSLKICSDTVRRMARNGEIPCIRIGRKYRFEERAVIDSLSATVTPPESAYTAAERINR